jgi:1-acyl-sn-glycerol-3-phosphate acyltransferase
MAKQDEARKSNQPAFSDEEIADMIEKFLAIEGPNEKTFERLYAFVQRYFAPTIVGLDNIPDEPTLFIGNHAEEKYSLVWRERYGFVRMAAQHGYNITPFGMVGPDDWWDHALEGRDLLHSRLVKLLQKMGVIGEIREDIMPPIPRGLFNTLLPKPERCFLSFGEPIEVPDCRGKNVSKTIQKSVRDQTAAEVESLVSDMLLLRAQNKHHEGMIRRLLTR